MKDAKKVACFGELLLRFSPDTDGDWLLQQQLPVYVGGAELNVATALGISGVPVKYITALPENELRYSLERTLASRSVELEALFLTGSRLGSYYLPQGGELKGAGVIYDRAHSAFASLKPGMINWRNVLADVKWLHLTAIDPALTKDLAAVCIEGLEVARSLDITISIDLNYRSKLWQYGVAPQEIMPTLLQYADLIMGNIWAVESLLGIPAGIADSKGLSDAALIEAAQKNIKKVQHRFPKASTIVYTFRLSDRYFSYGYKADQEFVSQVYTICEVVDRAGSGDCFMAGLIYGSLNGLTFQQQLDLAGAAAVEKMKEKGDTTKKSLASLKQKIVQ